MHDVFISHSSKDRSIANAICSKLESNGIRCWYAPRDIAPGEDWSAAIVNAISEARYFVLVFSKDSNVSHHVKQEVSAAFNNRCTIIPFKIDDCDISPKLSYYISNVHWLDAVTPPLENRINELYSRITNEPVPPSDPPTPPTPPQKKMSKKGIFIILALLILLFAAVYIYDYANNESESETERFWVQPIPLLDISKGNNHRYPFYGISMFSAQLDTFLVEDTEASELFLAKTSTGFKTSRNFENVIENPLNTWAVNNNEFDTIYFVDYVENSVRTFDKRTASWICKEPVDLQLGENEGVSTAVYFAAKMSKSAEETDRIQIVVYDYGSEMISKFIETRPNGSFVTFDALEYNLKSVLSGVVKGTEEKMLFIDVNNQVVLFDFEKMAPVEIAPEMLVEEYMPYKTAGSDIFSPSGRYLITNSYEEKERKVYIWDIIERNMAIKQPLVFNTDNNSSVFFLNDNEIVYFSNEDNCLKTINLETQKTAIKLNSYYFNDASAFLKHTYDFHYSDKLQAFFFASFDSENLLLKLTMTDLDGNIIAQGDAFESPYENAISPVTVTDDMIFLSVSAVDTTQEFEDGIVTHVYRTRYYIDDEGNITFHE